MNWELLLNYVQVLIWPVLVTVLAVAFRRPLMGLFGRLKRAGAAGVEVEFGEAEEALRQADATLESISSSDDEDFILVEIDDADADEEDDRREPKGEERLPHQAIFDKKMELDRRNAIEQVLAEGVRLGWEYAKYGEAKPPLLTVEWSSTGTPHITDQSEEAAQRISDARRYKNQIRQTLRRSLRESETLLKEDHPWRSSCDYIFNSDSGDIWIAVAYDIASADTIHRVHDSYSSAKKYAERRNDRRQLGVLFIHHRNISPRITKIIKMLWTGDAASEAYTVRWVDSSDDSALIQAIYTLDDEYIPF